MHGTRARVRPPRHLRRRAADLAKNCQPPLRLPPARPVSRVSPSQRPRVPGTFRLAPVSIAMHGTGCCAASHAAGAGSAGYTRDDKHVERWRVHKFGGSSVADAACMERVARILEAGSASASRRRAVGLPRRHRCAAESRRGRRTAGGRRSPSASMRSASATRSSPTRCSRARRAANSSTTLDAGLPRHRRHPADRAADPLGVADRPRPHRRLRRDLVDAPVLALSARARPAARQGATGSTRATSSRSNGARSGPAVRWEESQANTARVVPRDRGARSSSPASSRAIAQGPADDARPQRQRLLRLDLRRAARRRGDPHLDRRRRRAERRSAPRARREGHRLAVLQRGDGARVLRREGDPSADDGAGGAQGHPDLDPQHVRARESRAR